jgi:hypothetical protein
VQSPFPLLKMRDDGSLNWVEGAKALEAAKERVGELARFWPGKHLILMRLQARGRSITAGGGTRSN